jgi:CubicO group peptidase (beta-lactamase class C family)
MHFLARWSRPPFAAAFAFVLPLAAQDPAPADLAELLAPIRAQHDVPALGAAVIVDGRLAAFGVDGIRRHGHPERVTADDLWHLGSCTKAMTATLLARQVEAGLLAWTTTVAEAPARPRLDDARRRTGDHARAAPATPRRRSCRPPGRAVAVAVRVPRHRGRGAHRVARTLLAAAPASPPGERFLYSNASYMIAGAIAECAGGRPWAELIREQLFAPLGLTSAGFGAPGRADATEQPWGHRPGKEGPSAMFGDNPPSLGPAGTVHMTLRDWAKFAALHVGAPAAGGKPLLRDETFAALRAKPDGGDYALGWNVTARPWAPGPILTHSGSNTMWFCVAWLAPDAKFAVLVTSNLGNAAKACDAAAAACIGRFAPKR